MAGAQDDDDPGFWPGYVAAVSGLVQGLLIMSMALGISIFAMSQLVDSAPKAADPQALEKGIVMAPQALTQAEPFRPADALANVATPPPAQALRPIRISFLNEATVTPASTAAVLGDSIGNRRAQGAASWQLEAVADLTDPRARRAGYLRIMGVRAVLMSLGITANAIDLKLRDEVVSLGLEGTGAEPEGLVTITPLLPVKALAQSDIAQ